jgi:3-methyl-2-oxobutanoate hydroxymethyltransferase
VIEALSSSGIPVMAHVGLRPQNVHTLGGYSIQRDREALLADAKAAESSGAFAIVLECIPVEIANEITQELSIPTIGIGAGSGCDGQILVMHDLLGLTPGRTPRHVKVYADLKDKVVGAVTQYRDEVRDGSFPDDRHTFH